jgi:peroxiredoxin
MDLPTNPPGRKGGLLHPKRGLARTLFAFGSCLPGVLLFPPPLHAQKQIAAIDFVMPDLSKLSDGKRILVIGQLALKIRTFSGCAEKGVLASELLNEADDAPRDVLMEVARTYAAALKGCPGQYDNLYLELARLLRIVHLQASLDDPRLAAALDKVDAEDREIQEAGFTLVDMQGKRWTLGNLRGKAVLVNFWLTGCPPCVHEIPALNALYSRFRAKGLVILAISGDDDAAALRRFLRMHSMSYPVLLDLGRKVAERFHVVGVPRSMVFDRSGKLTAQAIGSRTEKQFEEMLREAGLD